jgi:hypothetical protein
MLALAISDIRNLLASGVSPVGRWRARLETSFLLLLF